MSDSDDSSESEWEEVTDEPTSTSLVTIEPSSGSTRHVFPVEGVNITLTETDFKHQRKGKNKFDPSEIIRKQLNREKRELQIDLHKVNLLCLLGQGLMYNSTLNDTELFDLTSTAVLSKKSANLPKHIDLGYMEKFVRWFKVNFPVLEDIFSQNIELQDSDLKPVNLKHALSIQLKECAVKNNDYLVFIFILILRSMGIQVRLIWSFQPLPLKAKLDTLKKAIKSSSTCPPSQPSGSTPKNALQQRSITVIEDSKKDLSVGNEGSENSDDSDFMPIVKKKKAKAKTNTIEKKSPTATKSDIKSKRVVSTKTAKSNIEFWAEVYLEEEERWVSVDLIDNQFLCDSAFERKVVQPICYVMAFGNLGQVKDVTRRYASQWLTATQKFRVDSVWWNRSIRPFRGKLNTKDKEEDEFLDQQVLSQPHPKSIQEFKNHPLFVLRRHLLKFEAIYPPEPMPVGFIRNEPFYSRECVKILHSREPWLKKAKVVRLGETPYKVVKSRPKYIRLTGQIIKDQPLELFGEWQVEDYVPPVAKDGKVPRNEYGNVNLFMEKMLPGGTVHLDLPGLQRVARKLDIDCANAVVGFDFHGGGGSHPIFQGFVVCEEYKDILLDAWNQDQNELVRKEEEKRTARIYGNWARLIKGVLIRERLENRYSFNLGGKRKVSTADYTTNSSTPEIGNPSSAKRRRPGS